MNDAGLGMLGRYELRARLGRGGFATVYRAWDPRLRREVALKALSLDWSEDEDVVRRFLAEAQKLAALQHPNIVTVYELSDPSERPYFTMELIEGRSLAELLQHGGRLVLPHVVEVVARLADAIDTLHAARVVHRDVKTPNVMLSNSGRVVLMDLGIARDMSGPQMTAHSRLLLSPESAAPEQIQGRMAGPAADIYALGIITYQMLAGRPPFQGDTAALLYAHVHTLPPPLANLCPGLPPPVYAAVDAALRKDPAARPASAGAFARMLTGAAPAPTLDHGEDADRPMPPTGEAATRPWPPVAPTAAATAPAMRPPAAPAARPGSLHWAVAAGAVAAMVVLTILGAGLLRLRPGGTGSAVTAGALTSAAPPVETCTPPEGGSLPLGADPRPLTLPANGERLQLTFGACKGVRVGLALTQVRTGDAAVDLTVLSPATAATDGRPVAKAIAGKEGKALTVGPLPLTGLYTVEVSTKAPAGGAATLTLSPEIAGAIEADGDPVAATIDRPGQEGRWSFEGFKDQRLTLAVSRVRFDGEVTVRLLAPDTATADGHTVVTAAVGTDGKTVAAGPLPATGTYHVVLSPGLTTGSAALTLSSAVESGAAPGNPPVTLSLERPGQQGRLTFEGRKGQQVSLVASRVEIGPTPVFGALAHLAVLDPDGKALANDIDVGKDGRYVDTLTLPADGSYAAIVTPAAVNAGRITLALYDVQPVTAAITPGGPPVTVTTTTPGQKPALEFKGSPGQRVSVVASAVGIGPTASFGAVAHLAITGPDGKPLVKDVDVAKDGRYLDTVALAAAGTYTIVVTPVTANTGSMTLTLHNAAPVTATLTVGGPPVSVAVAVPGQKPALTFDGVQGQRLRLTVSSLTVGPTASFGAVAQLSVLGPDGTPLVKETPLPPAGKTLDPFTLPAAGLYTIVLNPTLANTGRATLTLSGN